MKPWTRVDAELATQRRSWKWLADTLVISAQTINHWKARGVPAKYYADIEDALGKRRGWVLGDDVSQSDTGLSTEAQALGWLLDQVSNRLDKTIANNEATAAILAVLQKTAVKPTDTPERRVIPRKQPS
jgi:hypothetical protein